MKLLRIVAIFSLAWLCVGGGNVFAHFLWLKAVDGKVHVYFAEEAAPDDPELLKLVAKAEAWGQVKDSQGATEFKPIELELGDESLVGEIPAKAGIWGLDHNYGVMTRGGETFNLRYYAKTYTNEGITTAGGVADKNRLPLEITPRWQDRQLILKVTWLTKAAADVEVIVRGAGVTEDLKTNAAGEVSLTPTEPGVLSVRTKLVEDKAGTQDEKTYTSIRHYSTLTLPLEPPTMLSTDHSLAPLERGITSLGAAVAGDSLYLYGGHFGGAHHYSSAGQSGEFKRQSLVEPGTWESLQGGPKLTGLAMVAYNGKLYRAGGFTAKNPEDKEQDLWSQKSFAMFDPSTGKWTELPPLPAGRSSHDAAVLDGKLYVVGGWNMQGDQETEWHTTAAVCDLTQDKPEWNEIEVPFKRRALSVAAYDGKLYVIGGMQADGNATTRTDVYDPASQLWSEGPTLLGNPMDGFGSAAFAVGDRLLVSTMSGSVQQLAADGKSWKIVGQLKDPRFFHRMLATGQGTAVVVGGASMQTGKVLELEVITPLAVEAK